MKKKHLLLIFLNILCCNYLFAQTWNGNTSTDWNTASNWAPANVPIASGNVTIPGSLARYPVLASNVTINSINMQSGSELDVNGFTFTVATNTSNYNYFVGATLNNSNGSSDIVINTSATASGYYTQLTNTTFNDNVTVNISGVSSFNGADAAGTANTFMGNATFNMGSTGALNLSNSSASQYNGNLTINRTVAGNTQLFNAGVDITGNFSFSNGLGGSLVIGSLTQLTSIGGKIDITHNQTVPLAFQLYHVINQTAGGIINVQNSSSLSVQKDTLKVKSFSLTGYRSNAAEALFYNNDITGNLILADDAANTLGYGTYFRSNVIKGNTDITVKGENNGFFEADEANSENHFTGNVNYTVTGTADLSISNGDTSKYDGNLIINRTGAGVTGAFNSGAIIGGDFSFTNNTAGNASFGNLSKVTSVGGKVDIRINDATPGLFTLHRMINETNGGIINVKNTATFNLQKDTLKVSSLSITGYKSNTDFARFYNNDITGNLILADDAANTLGYGTYFRSNVIKGNTDITVKGENNGFFEADEANSENHFTGNVNYTVTGTADLSISNGDTSKYDGNLIINRTGAGVTGAFNSGAIIGGNFSFTNNTAGNSSFGNLSEVTSVGGKVDITINDATPGLFTLHRMINETNGGIINVKNTATFNLQKDTLKVSSLSITGYKSNTDFARFYNNDITGNLILADDAANTLGYGTYLWSNMIKGNTDITVKGENNGFFDADASNSGNHYTGNVTYNKNGTATLTVGTGDTTSIGGGLSLNSTAIVLSKIQFTDDNDGVVQITGDNPIIIPTMIMNKGGTAKITLMDTLKVTGSLNMISGIIETGVNSNLVLPDNITYMGGSDSSYVDGPMLKIGNQAFTFPVGQNNKYAPITITAPGAVTEQFRAQYINETPHDAGYDSTKRDVSIDHISREEYWLLDRTAGTSNVSVTIGWANNRSGIVNDIPSLRVARWDGSKWKDLGHGATTGTNAMGTIQTAAVVTSFSPFTLASTNTMNPLPVTLLNFEAVKQDQNVLLSWSTANEVNFSHFEIERAGTDNQFIKIGQQDSHNSLSATQYTFIDNSPKDGINLYRLKMIGVDRKGAMSKIKAINFAATRMISVYPNPASSYIRITAPGKVSAIEITDISGKIVKRMMQANNDRYLINDLKKGMYLVKVFYDDSMSVSKLVVE